MDELHCCILEKKAAGPACQDMLHRTDYAPFRIASFPILDKVKRLDGAKGGQQLSALVVSQVVGKAAHKHTLIGIYHLQQQSCHDFFGFRKEQTDLVIAMMMNALLRTL